ncbi:MAG: TRAP transporter substrate-binding protein [Rhodospirillaceae bacterium]|nr:TRAP transporter substrate-binding protein [Rhodospirillaceae bacterium]
MHYFFLGLLGLFAGAQVAAAEIEITLVSNSPAGGPGDKLWRMFDEAITAKSGGRMSVKQLVHGELGGDDVGFQAVRKGRGQMGIAGENGYAQALPEASVLNLPFLFSSIEECDFVFDNYWTPEAKKIASSRDIELLQWVEIGWMQVYGKKPLLTPEDAKGYRMRSLPYEASQAFLKIVGADTIVLPTPDLIPALQTGLISGGESSLLMYVRTGVLEYAPQLTMTNHSFATSGLFANKRWLERLSPEDRAIVSSAFPNQDYVRSDTRASLSQEAESAKAKGVVIHELSPEQRKRWEDVTRPMHRAVVDRLGPVAAKIYDLVQEGKRAFATRK